MSSNSGWPEQAGTDAPLSASQPPPVSNIPATPVEDPPFSGWDVTKIGFLMFVAPVLLIEPIIVLIVKKTIYAQVPIADIAQKPWIVLGPQFVWFALIAGYLLVFSKMRFHQTLWQAIRWNWPKQGWPALIGIGIATLVVLTGLEHLLPLPKQSPFDQFFKTPADAYAFAFLAIAFAPFMEELFFRGFLYPVLARRFGVAIGIFFTALPFALIHAFEYKAWGPVLIVFFVGVVLTVVRAAKKSVGASFIVHSIYNGIPIILAIIASRGFRHLDKLAQ